VFDFVSVYDMSMPHSRKPGKSDTEAPARPVGAPRRSRSPERDRPLLLRATRRVAAQRGYDATRFADVAAATGVPISSLQYYFGTRDRLVREAITDGALGELARLERQVASLTDPRERLRAVIASMIAMDDDERREGWLVWMEFWRTAMRDPELSVASVGVLGQWRQFLASIIDEGRRMGRFDFMGTTEDAVTELMALLDGLGIPLALGHEYCDETRAIRIATRAAERMFYPGNRPTQ